MFCWIYLLIFRPLWVETFSYLQSLPFRLRCRLPLWLWHLSLVGSCARPSAWSWQTAALLLWSLRRHPCQTDTRSRKDAQVWARGHFSESLETLGKPFDLHLFKGILELLHANHPGRFCQKLWGHQVYKVLKVNSAAHWRENQKERHRNQDTAVTMFGQFDKVLCKTHGSCWYSGPARSAPSPWACSPSSSWDSPGPYSWSARPCLYRTR